MTRSLRADSVWSDRLATLQKDGLERRLKVLDGPAGPMVDTSDGVKLNFCSNDYLGLANNPEIKQTLADASLRWGSGAGASRLVSGNQSPHDMLEKRMARFMGTEAAVVFVSGYQANVGALSALTGPNDAIFSDELVHASLIDGARLSKAEVHIYRHSDMHHLEKLLLAHDKYDLKLIITDSVFSMDGDIAKLVEIDALARAHNALIYVDEAHALGVMGPGGRGVIANCSNLTQAAVRIGTFSKALGVSGAFVALPEAGAGLLRSRARSLLYTTAPPPPIVEAVSRSLELVEEGEQLRDKLYQNIKYFKKLAKESTLPMIVSSTPIQPVLVGSKSSTMRASSLLWDEGVFVQGIRPPTVPEGKSRLRVTLSASHSHTHIEQLVNALSKVLSAVEE